MWSAVLMHVLYVLPSLVLTTLADITLTSIQWSLVMVVCYVIIMIPAQTNRTNRDKDTEVWIVPWEWEGPWGG